MKRILAFVLLISIFTVTACSKKRCAADILTELMREYPIDATVYSSLLTEGEEGYIGEEMLSLLYQTDVCPVAELALVFYGKVDTVREIGVFIVGSGEEYILVSDLVSRRLELLSSFSEGEGFIRKHKNVLIYGFVEDASYAKELLDSIL